MIWVYLHLDSFLTIWTCRWFPSCCTRRENGDVKLIFVVIASKELVPFPWKSPAYGCCFRSIYRSTDDYGKNYKGNMNLLHVVMWWKIRCLWRAGPEMLFQGYEGSILPPPSPACEKETGIVSLARMTQQGRSLSRLSLLPALFSRCQGNCIWPSAQSLGDFPHSTPSFWSQWLCGQLPLLSSPLGWNCLSSYLRLLWGTS